MTLSKSIGGTKSGQYSYDAAREGFLSSVSSMNVATLHDLGRSAYPVLGTIEDAVVLGGLGVATIGIGSVALKGVSQNFSGILDDEFGSGSLQVPSGNFSSSSFAPSAFSDSSMVPAPSPFNQYVEDIPISQGQPMAGFTDALGGVVNSLASSGTLQSLTSSAISAATGVTNTQRGLPVTLPAGWTWRSTRKGQRPYRPYKQMTTAERCAYFQGRRVGRVRGIRQQRWRSRRYMGWQRGGYPYRPSTQVVEVK